MVSNAVIVVEQSFSWCSACEKRVVVEQERHDDVAGDWRLINPGEVIGGGCGGRFVAITSGVWAYGPDDLAELRDDLPAIPMDVVALGYNK
jgi:hypothetical protein